MTIDDHRVSAVVRRPVVANLETELVHLPGGLAKQSEIADFARAASLHFFFHSGVGDDQASAIQNIVADQGIQKGCNLRAKFRWLPFELAQSFDDAVS